MSFLILVFGLGIVVLGSNYLVEGASSLAKRLRISDLVIGLTIVAFGTSTPELTVSLYAALQGKTDIAIGNVLGSNIFNACMILGIAAAIHPVQVQRTSVRVEIPLSILAAIVLAICANDAWLDGQASSALTRTDGLIFLCFFVVFIYYTFSVAQTAQEDPMDQEAGAKFMPMWKSISFVVLGLVGLYFGGKFMVDGAVEIAQMFGLSEQIIGLTIIAAGTSVPELATSATAAFKRNSDIAIGNVVGSNIFNIFGILGISATISPLPFSPASNPDLLMTILSSLLIFVLVFTGKGRRVSQKEGWFLMAVYIAYVVYLVLHVA